MAEIRLTGKYAVGESQFALVDDDMVDFLSQWKWKAKINGSGSNVYAVRNTMLNGKCVTVRMHRVVVGLARTDLSDVDHVNHNPLDNRRANLVRCTRSENIANARRIEVNGRCQHCAVPLTRVVSACIRNAAMSCESCRAEKLRARQERGRTRAMAAGARLAETSGSSARKKTSRALRTPGFN